jgi:hypothetical protein
MNFNISTEIKSFVTKGIKDKMSVIYNTISLHQSSQINMTNTTKKMEIEEIEQKYYKYKLKYLQLKKILKSKNF